MCCLIVLTVIALQLANAQPGDSTRVQRQEKPHVSTSESPVVLTRRQVPDTTLESLLLGRTTSENLATAIESLLTQHPRLRSLLLREILIPTIDDGSMRTFAAGEEFSERVKRMSHANRFELMSLAAKRYRELYQYSAENRLIVPQFDVIGMISWIIVGIIQVLK